MAGRDDDEDRCECGHIRHHHANGCFRCRWCRCEKYRAPVVPDIFDDVPDATDLRSQEPRP